MGITLSSDPPQHNTLKKSFISLSFSHLIQLFSFVQSEYRALSITYDTRTLVDSKAR